MKLFIFRHGQTVANHLKMLAPSYDDPLSELNEIGEQQARDLRDKLANEKLPIIYASPLKRAKRTGEIVAEANDAKLVIVDELREHYLGEAEGLSEADAWEKYGCDFEAIIDISDLKTYDVKLPEAESKREALNRFKKALAFIKQNCLCDKAGVATHGHIMRNFYYDLYKIDHIFKNTEYFVIDL